MPLIFVAALAAQSGQPSDVAFGRYVRQSGLAIPLVLLIFGAIWLFPLITALVAGDIVAAEDHNGTLKTILTRSIGRGRILTGKLLATGTYATVAVALMGATAIVAGSIESGYDPLTSLSGTRVSADRALLLVLASLGVYLLPILALACVGVLLSVVSRNSAGAVVGTLMFSLGLQLVGILPGLGGVKPYLLTEQFQAWQGLLGSRPTSGRSGTRVALPALRARRAGAELPRVRAAGRHRRLTAGAGSGVSTARSRRARSSAARRRSAIWTNAWAR